MLEAIIRGFAGVGVVATVGVIIEAVARVMAPKPRRMPGDKPRFKKRPRPNAEGDDDES